MTDYNYIYAIILNFNSSNDTIELYSQLIEFYKNINIIIVDNKSFKEEIKLLKKFINEDHLILNEDNYGYAKGNNIGSKRGIKMGAKFIWILNPDIRITTDTLPILLKTIKQEGKIAAVGPRICFKNEIDRIYSDGGIINYKTCATSHINSNKIVTSINKKDPINEVDYVDGSSVLFNVQALKENGLMLEDFFLYFEETEWCNRVKKNNWNLFVNTEALAFQTASPKGENYQYYMTRNRLIFSKLENDNYKYVRRLLFNRIFYQFFRSIIKGKFEYKIFSSRLLGFINGTMYKIDGYNENIFSFKSSDK